MENGVVKHFNNDSKKRFGFIQTEDGEELFFHLNDGRTLNFQDGPHFIEGTKVPDLPKKGEIVHFLRGEGRLGVKASPWGFDFQLRASRKKVGMSLLSNCDNFIDRFPCLPHIIAEAKRPGDMGKFTVKEDILDNKMVASRGSDTYVSGLRNLYFVLTKTSESGWIYLPMDYSRYTSWDSEDVGNQVDFHRSESIGVQWQKLSPPWNSQPVILRIDTSRLNNTRNEYSEFQIRAPRREMEKNGVYKHEITVYVK